MTPFTLVDRYLGRSVAVGTALVLGVFAALFAFIVLVDALPDYGKNGFDAYRLARYVLLSQPRKLYDIFPVAVLIGTLLGLSTLALNSELIAMRAAGISRMRLIGAAMKTGAILVAGAVLAGEYIVPVAETRAQTGRAEALASGLQKGEAGLWLRDGAAFVNIGEVLPDSSLLNINIYELAPTYELRRHTYAKYASYKGDRWELRDVLSSNIGAQQIQTQNPKSLEWSPALTPDVVSLFTTRPEALSIMQLRAYIPHLARNNLDVTRYRLAFWQKLLMPLATALMMLLAVPFVFRSVRAGGLAQRVFAGIMLGLAFVIIHRASGHFAVLYGASPIIAAALPLVIFLVVAMILLRRGA